MGGVISSRRGPDQHHNIIWDIKKSLSGVQIQSREALSSYQQSAALPVPPYVDTIARGAIVTHGTQVYFSLSSYGYQCPAMWNEEKRHVPHYVFSYNMSGDEWSTLPACRVHDFGLAVVNELVTIVGGEYDKLVYDSFSLKRRGPPRMSADLLVLKKGKWKEHFPPMTMERKDPSVICVQQHLIVAGGVKFDTVNSVEVMNTETKVWSRVASLPEAACSLAAACCGDQLYFLGGRNEDGSMSSVFTCSVQSLVNSGKPLVMPFDSGEDLDNDSWGDSEEDSGEPLVKSSDIDSGESLVKSSDLDSGEPLVKSSDLDSGEKLENPVWRKAANVPVLRSTCVAINDELLAVGGRTSTYRPSADIYCYSPFEDSWQVAGQMPTARSMCIAASVMNKLVVVGGLKEDDKPTDVVEIGTLISDPTLTKKNLWLYLRSLEDWYTLGLQLDIPDDKLKEIEDAHPSGPARIKKTVDYWLKRGKNPSWETLAAALAAMDRLDIATQIQEKYLQKPAKGSSENSKTPKSKMVLCTSLEPDHGGKPDLADAFRITFPVAKKWKSIGIFLKVPPHQLDMIDIPQKDFDDCLRDMLSVWLTQINPPPTWQSLADAVRIINPAVAQQIIALNT